MLLFLSSVYLPTDILISKHQHHINSGLLDNVVSDYLWAKAVLLTTTTVATAGLSIQVPLATIVDSLVGNAPHLSDYVGAAAVMIGFTGLNIPSDAFSTTKEAQLELESGNATANEHNDLLDADR